MGLVGGCARGGAATPVRSGRLAALLACRVGQHRSGWPGPERAAWLGRNPQQQAETLAGVLDIEVS